MEKIVETKLLKTIPEAARELGIPVATFRRAAKRGDFPTYKSFSNRIRVHIPEVMDALRVYNVGEKWVSVKKPRITGRKT